MVASLPPHGTSIFGYYYILVLHSVLLTRPEVPGGAPHASHAHHCSLPSSLGSSHLRHSVHIELRNDGEKEGPGTQTPSSLCLSQGWPQWLWTAGVCLLPRHCYLWYSSFLELRSLSLPPELFQDWSQAILSLILRQEKRIDFSSYRSRKLRLIWGKVLKQILKCIIKCTGLICSSVSVF